MDQLNQLKEIILITESIIEDQKIIKEIAENLQHETEQLDPKQEELKHILSQTQEQLMTHAHISIDSISIFAK